MAKKEDYGLTDMFKKTEPTEPVPEKPDDPIKPRGIGLRVSEWEHITKIASELNLKPHALVMVIIRDWVKKYDRGEIETKQSKRLA